MDAGHDRLLALVDRLDDLLHEANGLPLTDDVAIPRRKAYDLVDEMRSLVLARASTSRDLLTIFDELDDLVHSAKLVPLTDQLRLNRDGVYALLDRIRETPPRSEAGARDDGWGASDVPR